AAGWRSGRVRWLRCTICRRTRRASGWLQGKQRKPYRQERGAGTRAVNPERADPRGARQRRAWRHLVSAAKLPIVCLGVNRISMVQIAENIGKPKVNQLSLLFFYRSHAAYRAACGT